MNYEKTDELQYVLKNVNDYELPNILIRTDKYPTKYLFNEDKYNELITAKNKIDKYYKMKIWDTVKKKINPFEFIYITNKNGRRRSVSRYEPVSRSFYKMIEISKNYLQHIMHKLSPLTTLHIAEGPGGFIEALIYLRKQQQQNHDNIYGMTLIKNDKDIPKWGTHLFKDNINVNIIYGVNGDGDLYNIDNHKYISNRMNDKADLITADGGFDFSIDYNNQEYKAQLLIFVEILCCVRVQKIGGIFICKMFDTFSYISVQLIYILYCLYDEVIIYKPKTSRPANSEKYLICKGFKGITKLQLDKLISVYELWTGIECEGEYLPMSIIDLLPTVFINEIKKMNNIFVDNQIKYIDKTIKYINDKSIRDDEFREQIKHAKEWCIKYNIPYNLMYINW